MKRHLQSLFFKPLIPFIMKTATKSASTKDRNDLTPETITDRTPRATMPTSKIGAPAIFDAKTGSYIMLPDGFRISQSNGKTWIGSSADGQTFLLAERFASSEQAIPSILAEGDLGLFLVSTRPAIEQISPSIAGIEASGEFAGKEIRAYLARVSVDKKWSYLVVVAGEAYVKIAGLRKAALDIAQRFVL